MSITIRQHIPAFIDIGDAPRKQATVETPADLDRVDWIAVWKDTPPHTFDHFAQSAEGGGRLLLMAVYDNGAYWWVLGYMSGPLSGLPEWAGGPDAG